MKKTRRFAAMLAAMALAATMVAPTMMNASADDTYTVTINDNGNVTAKTHSFSAYQIFAGTPNDGSTAFTGNSSSVDWGSAIAQENRASFITAIKNAFNNSINYPKINALTNDSSAYTVSEALSDLTSSADKAALADVIDSFITENSSSPAGTYAGSGNTAQITNLAGGYYFIKDTTSIDTTSNDATSKFILKVAGNQSITIKTDAPTLEKKIWHNDAGATPNTTDNAVPTFNNGSANGWADVGDNQIGDTVYYCIKTYIPDMSEYETYKYQINDTFSTGLTYDSTAGVTKMEVFDSSGNYLCDITTETTDTDSTTNAKPNVSINGQALTINFVDLKSCLANQTYASEKSADDTVGGYIYTYYQATLNASALVSAGANGQQNNPNTANLTYSNNPNQSGTGGTHPTSNTPDVVVYDWTYTYEIDKVDEANQPLAGATFSVSVGDDVQYFVPLTGSDLTTALANVKTADNTALTADSNTLYYRIAKQGDSGATTTIGDPTDNTHTKYCLIGLDDTKTYSISETAAPSGYSPITTPASARISDTYDSTGASLTELNGQSSGGAGVAQIQNFKNSELPSTGGMGTKLFIAGGGITATLAAVYLVSKKRSKED